MKSGTKMKLYFENEYLNLIIKVDSKQSLHPLIVNWKRLSYNKIKT